MHQPPFWLCRLLWLAKQVLHSHLGTLQQLQHQMATAAAVRMLQQTGHLQVLSGVGPVPLLVEVSQRMTSCCRKT
jgi:hypothetical protein